MNSDKLEFYFDMVIPVFTRNVPEFIFVLIISRTNLIYAGVYVKFMKFIMVRFMRNLVHKSYFHTDLSLKLGLKRIHLHLPSVHPDPCFS